MKMFIDESGLFLPNDGFSVVCSLALPHRTVNRVRREIERLCRDWPRHDGELKGGMLRPEHLIALVNTLYRRSAVLHCCAIDVSAEDDAAVVQHKANQCEGIIKHLTVEHHPEFVAKIWQHRRTLEHFPVQLYIQSIVMTDLVCAAANDNITYFSQRHPDELGNFEWVIDAKDPTRITTQEAWWRDTLGPLVQSKSLREPFSKVDNFKFNYRHLDKAFLLEKDMWLPDRPRERVVGYDNKKLMSDRFAFVDSRTETLLQTVDILTSFMRRVLLGKLTDNSVLEALGKLQIKRKRDGVLQSVVVMSLSHDASLKRPALSLALQRMSAASRGMMA